MTTAGIDDEKVSPTFNPKYTFEAVKIIVKIIKPLYKSKSFDT